MKIMKMGVTLLALLLCGCPPSPPPVPPSPDASDAAPVAKDALTDGPMPPPAATDAAPPPPPAGPCTSDCTAACAALLAAGCVNQPSCCQTLTLETAGRRIRNPKTGTALTCADLTKAKTAADVKALGQGCGP